MPTPEAPTVIERELALLLRRAQGYSAQLARALHPDLEAPAYSLLMWLADAGAARLTDMATSFGVGKATLSRQVQLLERLDLITRTPDPHDGRSQLLTVTAAAAERVQHVRQVRQQRFRALLDPWPTADVVQFGQLLTRFNRLVGDALESASARPVEPEPEPPADHRPRGTT